MMAELCTQQSVQPMHVEEVTLAAMTSVGYPGALVFYLIHV